MSENKNSRKLLREQLSELRREISELKESEERFRALEVQGICGIVRDISEKKQAEESLIQALQEWQTTFDATNDAILIVDQDMHILRANIAAEQLFQLPKDDLTGKHCWEIVHGTEQPISDCLMLRMKQSLHRETTELQIGDAWFNISLDPIPDATGGCAGAVHIFNDITEQKRTEKEHEALLQDTMERAKELSGLYGTARAITEMLSIEDLCSKTAGLIPPAWGYPEITRGRVVFDGQEYVSESFEQTIWKLTANIVIDGKVRGVLEAYYLEERPELDEGPFLAEERNLINGIVRMLGTAIQRLLMEKELRESENEFRSITENAVDFIFIKDMDRRYTFVNQVMHKVLGLSMDEIIGKTSEDIFGPEQGRFFDEIDDRSFSGETVNETMSFVIDEKELVFNSIQTPLTCEDGKITSIMGIVRDVTEHKRVDDALQKSESEKSLILDSMSELIVYRDKDMKTIWASKSVSLWLDKIPEEIIGRICYKDRYGLDTPCEDCYAMKTLKTGEPYKDVRNSPDGKYWDVTIDPVRNGNGDIIGIIEASKDITERKQAMEEKKRLEDQLRQAQKMEAVGQLAGGVAHDFNNILQGMFGSIMFAEEGLAPNDNRYKDIEDIREGAERAAALTRQLLTFSRRQIMQQRNIDLNDVVDGVLKMIRRVIGEHIELEFISGNQLSAVHADPGQIEQVLLNLCVNARDAMPEGGRLTLETQNVLVNGEYIKTHPLAKRGRYVLVSVTDTGHGMDAETVARIFEPFFTTKEVGKGSGLGLSMVHGIVKQHEGFIHAYSEVGEGTMFKVYLPMVEQRAMEVSSSIEGTVIGGKETILVAEDDQTVRVTVVRVLEEAGYTVHTADNGLEGVAVFKEHADEIDLALIDVIMPKLSGRQMYSRMRELKPDIPVLFSSGYSDNTIHTCFVLDEGIELIQKPYDPNALLRKVRERLDAVKETAGEELEPAPSEHGEKQLPTRVLVVDDNDRVRAVFRRTLEETGYEVTEAPDGKVACRLYRQEPFDLIIMDIIMPEKEGLQTIQELMGDYPDVKIIAVSGGGSLDATNYLNLAQQFGATIALEKPISPQELLDAIDQIFRGRGS